ncbi:IS3 family transposase [Streptomyces mirabilis]|uniref:IS3 family transposase n=1 Tax=Streptomyces mirabilis TaxID=68239 RepID=UPI00338F3AD6
MVAEQSGVRHRLARGPSLPPAEEAVPGLQGLVVRRRGHGRQPQAGAADSARRARQREEDCLVAEIRVLHAGSRGAYGAPRIHAALRRAGRAVNVKRVERLMRKHRIAGITRRRRRGLTRQARRAVFATDLIGRDFTAPRPGMRLVGESQATRSGPIRWGGGRSSRHRARHASHGGRRSRPGSTQASDRHTSCPAAATASPRGTPTRSMRRCWNSWVR